MPERHARLSPSAAKRWINCPGSVHLGEQCAKEENSSYAAEGTVAHALAEIQLRWLLADIPESDFYKRLNQIQRSAYYSAEMEEAINTYIDAVLERRTAAGGPDTELMIEQQFSLDNWVPESFGTSDAVILGDGVIEVIDLKYGKGVRVDAEDNPQLRLYALGAAALFAELYDFDRVRYTIIQPRLDHVSTEELTLAELLEWAETVVKPAGQLAMENAELYATGDWCQFCPAYAICRAQAEAQLALAKHEFRDPPLLTDDEIGDVLQKVEALEKWAHAIEAYALEQALAGKHYDGWKLVEGRSIRKYADDLKVAEALKSAGFDEAMLYERKLYGLTAMEKIVGKKRLTETLGDLIIKPAGKPTLVPASDKRQELRATAAQDFADPVI